MEETSNQLDFVNRPSWRSWLAEHHAASSEAWLVIQKKCSQTAGLFLDEAVEEALCFGWIDGKLRRRDENSYVLRFSPRKPNSVWSVYNIQRVEKLVNLGLMTETGLAAVESGKQSGQWQAALDRENTDEIPPELEAALLQMEGVVEAYNRLPDSQKKQYIYWLQSAKREQTKLKRIEEIVRQVSGG